MPTGHIYTHRAQLLLTQSAPILSRMAKYLPVSFSIAVLAIGLVCLSSSAQNHPTDAPRPFSFPQAPPQPNFPEQKKTPAKRSDTAPKKSAQTPQDAMAPQPDLNSGLMKLDVVVTDQQGRSVAGLSEKDLTLLDNGQPRKIVTFQAFDNAASKPDPPVEIILVIDELDIPPVSPDTVEQAAQKFLLQNDGHLAQPVKIYLINKDGLFASASPSMDGNALAMQVTEKNGLRTIWTPSEIHSQLGTTLSEETRFNHPQASSQSLLQRGWTELPHSLFALGSIAIEERRTPERKLLFWFGSGWPINQNRWQFLFDSITELSTRLREARIAAWAHDFWLPSGPDTFVYQDYLAGVTSEKSASVKNVALQVLAVQSGGGVLQGEGDAADVILQKAVQANSFYTITFDPARTQTVDEYHDLKIEIAKPGLKASTCTGYYDEPVYYDQVRTGAKAVTVAQLRDSMTELQHASDSESEQQLREMELTERLSSSNLAKWLVLLKSKKKAQQALTALADQSVFFSPPAEDTVNQAPPTIADQRQIIQRTIDYVSKTIPILPNLITERTTTLFLEPPRAPGQTWKTAVGDRSLEPVSIAKADVSLSHGKEIAKAKSLSERRKIDENRSLQTEGVFGPILASVLVAVAKPQSKLQWSRWEKGDNGPLAVFRYNVPKEIPIYHVEFCCLAVDFIRASFKPDAPTYGEITVNPATGAILRLTMRADLSSRLPLRRADIMVEYGPVMLGGISYICPIRSVSIARQRSIAGLQEFGERFKVYAPFETILNDVRYEKYHLFSSSSRMLPGFSEVPANK